MLQVAYKLKGNKMNEVIRWECPSDEEIFLDDDPRIIERAEDGTPFCPVHSGIKLIPAD